jgi:hypothetical protein
MLNMYSAPLTKFYLKGLIYFQEILQCRGGKRQTALIEKRIVYGSFRTVELMRKQVLSYKVGTLHQMAEVCSRLGTLDDHHRSTDVRCIMFMSTVIKTGPSIETLLRSNKHNY